MRAEAPSHPAHDSEIVVSGVSFWIRRDLALARRLEQQFGPLVDLSARLLSYRVTTDEIVSLYDLVLRGVPGRPERAGIEAHVFEVGVQRSLEPVTKLVLALFIGAESAAKIGQREAGREEPDARPQS
jgi:hypothetical protein